LFYRDNTLRLEARIDDDNIAVDIDNPVMISPTRIFIWVMLCSNISAKFSDMEDS
jgi:hypothetical protein